MGKKSLKLGDNTIYYGGDLPELVVTPAKWQIDYMNNFGNKELRRLIYDSIPMSKRTNMARHYGTLVEEKVKRAPFFIKSNPSLLSSYRDKMHNDFIDLILSVSEDDDFTDVVHRLYNTWNASGRPIISNDKSVVNHTYKENEERPNYFPILNKVYRANDIDDVIAELAHPIQMKQGSRNQWYNYIKDGLYNLFNEVRNDRSHYEDKNNYEFETHSVIEPQLNDYIFEGVSTKYVK